MAEMVTKISNFHNWTKNLLIKFFDENIEVRWHRGTLGTTSQFYNPKPEIVFRKFLCHTGRSAWGLPTLKI